MNPRRQKRAHPFVYDISQTAAFKALKCEKPELKPDDVRAVVIGGGTGAPVSIRTLVSLGASTSAVVAMADDGGSTGILRDEADVTPPGDVRKCIAAFAADPDDPLTRAFKSRFEFADNHTLGNLMLSALEDACGSFPQAISICEELLHAQGHVYPSTLNRVTLVARTRDGRRIEGQAVACHSRSALERVSLSSNDPIVAYEPAVRAIREADLIVLGPGSLFTSIIPNVIVPGIAEAIRASSGTVVFVCSLADMQGETWGLSALEYYDALRSHGMDGVVDYMFIHDGQRRLSSASRRVSEEDPDAFAKSDVQPPDFACAADPSEQAHVRPVRVSDLDIRAIESCGTRVVVRDFVDPARPTWHEPHALREALREVIACRSQRR